MTLTAAFNHFKFDFLRSNHTTAATSVNLAEYEMHSPYMILGVRRNASDSDIKRAWRKQMMANHPDLGGSVDKAMAINNAYKEICKRRGF